MVFARLFFEFGICWPELFASCVGLLFGSTLGLGLGGFSLV